MRLFRNKANRKTLAFFRINFRIGPPYRVRSVARKAFSRTSRGLAR